MKVGVVSSNELCIPLLQLLQSNRITGCLFVDVENRNDFSEVAYFCQAAGVTMQESAGSVSALYQWLDVFEPHVVFVLGYKHKIDLKQIALKLRDRFFNIHFGPLPAYRGPNPVFWQIRNGLKDVTTTIHKVTDRFDAGPVVWCKAVTREEHFTYAQVNRLLSYICVEGVGMILQNVMQNRPITEQIQPVAGIAYHERPGVEQVTIYWDKMAAKEIVLLINACSSWNKGAITFYNGQEAKIMDAFVVENETVNNETCLPGTIINCDSVLKIGCLGGAVLQVTMLNLSGIYVPERNIQKFGFAKGQKLG
jgi:methionyl-tRNA formyltransferase